jgi:hypothetical protein
MNSKIPLDHSLRKDESLRLASRLIVCQKSWPWVLGAEVAIATWMYADWKGSTERAGDRS